MTFRRLRVVHNRTRLKNSMKNSSSLCSIGFKRSFPTIDLPPWAAREGGANENQHRAVFYLITFRPFVETFPKNGPSNRLIDDPLCGTLITGEGDCFPFELCLADRFTCDY